MIALVTASALAAPVAATVEVDGGVVAPETARSVVWHALAATHEPLVLDGPLERAPAEMARAQASTLLRVDVAWKRDALWLDARVVWADAPVVRVTEYVLRDGALRVADVRDVVGEPVAVRTAEGWLVQPERSLEGAVEAALGDVTVPAWGGPVHALRVPVVVLADEAFQQRHGASWAAEARERLDRAGALLGPAGLGLELVDLVTWSSPDGARTPGQLLEALADHAPADPVLRIGLSGRSPRLSASAADDVGAAYVPGRHLVVLDHGEGTAHEAIAVAHEVLHALGVPHPAEPGLLMSPTLSSAVHRLDPASRELARAAAWARWGEPDDPEAAAHLLADAAATWLDDPAQRLAYVARNLAAAQGADDHATRWAALARRALGEPVSAR